MTAPMAKLHVDARAARIGGPRKSFRDAELNASICADRVVGHHDKGSATQEMNREAKPCGLLDGRGFCSVTLSPTGRL